MRAPPNHRQRGMVIVLILVLLATAAMLAVAKRSDPSNDRDLAARRATQANLAKVEGALAAFVMQNKRLPCPASGLNLASQSSTVLGLERRLEFFIGSVNWKVCQVTGPTNTSNEVVNGEIRDKQYQTFGVVPWRTLGLKRTDALDGWGNLLTYRVAPDLVKDNSMDLSSCRPNGGGPLASSGNEVGRCKTFNGPDSGGTDPGLYTQGKGLKVMGSNSVVLMTPEGSVSTNNGAAYVVISHGENGAGAFSAQGVAQAGLPASGNEEGRNAATAAFSIDSIPSFFDGRPSQDAGLNHFDDIVLRPTIIEVAVAASIGPRARPQ